MNIPHAPGDKVVMFDMTDDRKDKFKLAANNAILACKNAGLTPIETFAVLNFCMEILSEQYGIKASKMYGDEPGMRQ